MTYIVRRIIDKYSALINEYFKIINEPETLHALGTNVNMSVFIGLNTIHRVFEYIILKMNSIENAYYHSQKACYYYLEYLKRIHNSELLHSLNHIDAVLFIYKKTIYEFYDGEQCESSTCINNLMSLNDEYTTNEENIKQLLNKLASFTKTLFFWESKTITFEQRMDIGKKYLKRFIQYTDCLDVNNTYLEKIQNKFDIDYAKYNDLLFEILHKHEKRKKYIMNSDIDENDYNYLLLRFYTDDDVFSDIFHNGTTKELVKWLYI